MPVDWYPLLAGLVILALGLLLVTERRQSARPRERAFKSLWTSSPTGIADTRIVGADDAWRSLTKREKQIAGLVAHGFSNDEIAARLGIKSSTVNAHLRNIYDKLQVHSRAELGYRIRDFID
jgi:DNA-binding NarL/FixJ family response regulator